MKKFAKLVRNFRGVNAPALNGALQKIEIVLNV